MDPCRITKDFPLSRYFLAEHIKQHNCALFVLSIIKENSTSVASRSVNQRTRASLSSTGWSLGSVVLLSRWKWNKYSSNVFQNLIKHSYLSGVTASHNKPLVWFIFATAPLRWEQPVGRCHPSDGSTSVATRAIHYVSRTRWRLKVNSFSAGRHFRKCEEHSTIVSLWRWYLKLRFELVNSWSSWSVNWIVKDSPFWGFFHLMITKAHVSEW